MKTAPLLFLVIAVGIISYLLISSTAPFKAGVFNSVNPKPASQASGQQPGTWVNVTPSNMDLVDSLDCGNFGADAMVVDPARPSNLYTHADCQGIWKSTDYGQTWSGPINTGTNGPAAGNGAGGLAIAQGPAGQPPILIEGNIRGGSTNGGQTGIWVSTDGGVNWIQKIVVINGTTVGQDIGAPAIDPLNPNHWIELGHEQSSLVYETFDGGNTWHTITVNSTMSQAFAGFVYFINNGNAADTARTWLWVAQATGGNDGTWRTTDDGVTWTQVSTGEKPHGPVQFYQPDTKSGVIFQPEIYAAQGWGILRSTDFGQTWSLVTGGQDAVVVGTPNNLYAMWGWACGFGCTVTPNLMEAPQPGTSGWFAPGDPPGMTQGPGAVAVSYDGSNYFILGSSYLAGLWRYVEPKSGQTPAPTPTLTATPSPTPIGSPVPTPTPGTNSFTGEYWNSGTGSSPSIPTTLANLVRNDPTINFNWGNGSPDPSINADHFIARWNGNFTFSAGSYTFTAAADDGMRLYIDNNLVMDHWVDESAPTYTLNQTLTSGTHTIRMEYYEDTVTAQAMLSWAANSTPAPTSSPTPQPTISCAKASLGDINCDGLINIFDYNTLVSNFGKTEPANTNGDLDGNGTVNIFDYNILVSNFGK